MVVDEPDDEISRSTAEQPNDSSAIPRVLAAAAPLQSEQQLDGRPGKEHEAYEIEGVERLDEALAERRLGHLVRNVDEGDEGSDYDAYGEIYVEACG